MDKWAAPLAFIVILVFGVLLFFTQNKGKESAELPSEAGVFRPISLTPGQGQQQQVAGAQQQQQQQAQGPQPTFGVEEGMKASYSAVIRTTRGTITVNLRADAAPNTVKNFIQKSQSGFYKNLTFHRVEDWVLQGGDPQGDGSGGGQMLTELSQLPFVKGTLGVARRNDIRISNDSQFFITKTDANWLDQQYTNFGSVTDGMNVVENMKVGDKILSITVQE